MYQTILFIAVFAGMVYAAARQIPPEGADVVEARRRYGKVKD